MTYTYKMPKSFDINPQVSAYIATSKNRLKVYSDSKVYLPTNTEFQIEFENHSNTDIQVKVKLNGKYISTSGLIIEAGDHYFLERWLDDNRKFIFNTFEVDDVKETEQQRERNGTVEIEFYKPQIYIPRPSRPFPDYSPQKMWYDAPTFGGGHVGDSRTLLCDSNNTTFTSNGSSLNVTNTSQPAKVETGRVEQGAESNQSFNYVSADYELAPFKRMSYQILPESEKAKRVTEIRHYCSECGMRQRKDSWNFCPRCGIAM